MEKYSKKQVDILRSMDRFVASLFVLLLLLVTLSAENEQVIDNTEKELGNPYLEQKEAIEEGEQLYRSRCVGCHMRQGGRGPNIFKTRLTDKQFLETVTKGRKGTNMPAFGKLLSPDEIWKVHAFVMSRDRL